MTELASSSNDMNQSHVPLQDISNANMATETMNINLPDFAENNVMIEKPQIIRNISAPNKIINITMDGAVINDINQDLTSNELPNDGNINAQNNMFTITLEESENAKNNINEESRSDELPDLVNIDTPDINMTLEETSETYDETETNENYPSIQVPSISNIKVPGKTINITLDESASNNIGTKKPVAKIEILSSTVIKNGNGDMNSGQTWQLPKVYAQALADMNNQNTSRHHETSTQSVKSASRSLMDINQLLDFRDDVPMEEDNQHELETPVSSGNVEKLTVSEHDETVPRQSDSVLYTASNRGALQLILNRFMYYCHYQRQNGRKRRWRCIEYRDQKCLAAIDTVGEQIVERKHIHCHPNHDDKICRKMTRRDVKVFTTIQMAEDVLKKKKTS
ncbi:GATA zinc finger domain-containing protein 7-like isoform X1 [Leguminivora glycinivorella]|uniref:GATA zinc finger domain-containing protein 7-like isoform X1 n=1 Tax=Leguminivora glycinivorella TaxID=1035111 RepID=UPI00200E9F13|nr:GATA zinc finger domain-containing protein 7-like isoform X1 [Leguminivora glycinivorella]